MPFALRKYKQSPVLQGEANYEPVAAAASAFAAIDRPYASTAPIHGQVVSIALAQSVSVDLLVSKYAPFGGRARSSSAMSVTSPKF